MLLGEKVGKPVTAEADHDGDHPDPHHSDAVRQADVAEGGDVQQNAKAEGGAHEVVEFVRVRIVSPHLNQAKDLKADVGPEPENGEGTHLENEEKNITLCHNHAKTPHSPTSRSTVPDTRKVSGSLSRTLSRFEFDSVHLILQY